MKKFKFLAVIFAALLVFTACSSSNTATTETSEVTKVRVGTVGTNEEKIWNFVKEKVAKEGIELEVVVFTDYNQPNDALANGDIELNAFQHYIFLEGYNAERGADLTPIGETLISPLGIYSQKIKDVSELKDGDTIAIPNDPTNGGRALKLLEVAGLIKVDASKGNLPTVLDIQENKLNLNILEVDASQTARSLPDVAASIVNGGMAVDAGLVPAKDAIFLEKLNASSKPYINIIVSRAEDKDSEVYAKIVEVYRQEDTAKVIEEVTSGAAIAVWTLAE